jgi:hypothetical protein
MSLTKIEPAMRTRIYDAAQHPTKPHLFQCAGCRKWFGRNALQVDHKTPEVESFPEQRSDIDNLQLLCAPKGSTWINSCHKKKTRKEAQARARRNKVPRQWMPVFVFGAGTVISSRFTFLEVFAADHVAAVDWLQWSGLSTGALFSTYLVQKAWRRRRPRRAKPAEPVSRVEAPVDTLDQSRIIEAFRELVGPKGDVRVTNVVGMDDFTVTYQGTGFEDHKEDKQYEALLKIQAKLNDRWLPWWDTGRDRVRFTRRPVLPKRIPHPGFDPDRPWNILPVAPEHHFDLTVTSHILIIGRTNAGKTALMRSLTCAVANTAAKDGGTELMLADPKLVELMGYEGWDGVLGIYSEDQELWDMAFDLHDDMMHRYWLRKHKKVPFSEHRRRIVILDEFEEWVERMLFFWVDGAVDPETGKPYKQAGKVSPAHRKIMSVLRMARLCGIHLIIGTQRPDASWFGGSARDNLEGRAAVGAVSADAARMVFGNSSIGRDIPKGLKGRTTFQTLDGTPEEIQAYWTPDPANNKGDNTIEDWTTLVRLGMPKDKLPDDVRELIAA